MVSKVLNSYSKMLGSPPSLHHSLYPHSHWCIMLELLLGACRKLCTVHSWSRRCIGFNIFANMYKCSWIPCSNCSQADIGILSPCFHINGEKKDESYCIVQLLKQVDSFGIKLCYDSSIIQLLSLVSHFFQKLNVSTPFWCHPQGCTEEQWCSRK